MKSFLFLALLLCACFAVAEAQERSQDDQPHVLPKNLPQPKEEAPKLEQGESSSKDSEINLETPGRTSSSGAPSTVHETLPYDPHKAAKDIEVGQYYLKRKNYRAALDRFNEALLYKPNDAEAVYRLAQTQEKLELYALAYQNYRSYQTIFKEGPYVKEAQEAMQRIEPRLPKAEVGGQQSGDPAESIQEGESYLTKNDFESAHASFVRALQMAPDDPVANFRLAQSLQGLQRLDEARIFYKKYLSLQPGGKMAGEAKREIAQINFVLGKP
jgi:tetratricopeptide (TPR) repeat protein